MEFAMFVSWAVVGLLAGWLAGFVMKGGGYWLIGDLFLGLVGASWGAGSSGASRVVRRRRSGALAPVTCGVMVRTSGEGSPHCVGGSEKAVGRRPTSFRTCAAKLTSTYQSHFLKRSSSPSAHARATA